jgi:hypothetical protein
MLATLVYGAQKSKERRDEIIETSLSVIHQLSIQPDSTIHSHDIEFRKTAALTLIGQAMLGGDDLTEDKAKKGLQYLDNSRRLKDE